MKSLKHSPRKRLRRENRRRTYRENRNAIDKFRPKRTAAFYFTSRTIRESEKPEKRTLNEALKSVPESEAIRRFPLRGGKTLWRDRYANCRFNYRSTVQCRFHINLR